MKLRVGELNDEIYKVFSLAWTNILNRSGRSSSRICSIYTLLKLELINSFSLFAFFLLNW